MQRVLPIVTDLKDNLFEKITIESCVDLLRLFRCELAVRVLDISAHQSVAVVMSALIDPYINKLKGFIEKTEFKQPNEKQVYVNFMARLIFLQAGKGFDEKGVKSVNLQVHSLVEKAIKLFVPLNDEDKVELVDMQLVLSFGITDFSKRLVLLRETFNLGLEVKTPQFLAKRNEHLHNVNVEIVTLLRNIAKSFIRGSQRYLACYSDIIIQMNKYLENVDAAEDDIDYLLDVYENASWSNKSFNKMLQIKMLDTVNEYSVIIQNSGYKLKRKYLNCLLFIGAELQAAKKYELAAQLYDQLIAETTQLANNPNTKHQDYGIENCSYFFVNAYRKKSEILLRGQVSLELLNRAGEYLKLAEKYAGNLKQGSGKVFVEERHRLNKVIRLHSEKLKTLQAPKAFGSREVKAAVELKIEPHKAKKKDKIKPIPRMEPPKVEVDNSAVDEMKAQVQISSLQEKAIILIKKTVDPTQQQDEIDLVRLVKDVEQLKTKIAALELEDIKKNEASSQSSGKVKTRKVGLVEDKAVPATPKSIPPASEEPKKPKLSKAQRHKLFKEKKAEEALTPTISAEDKAEADKAKEGALESIKEGNKRYARYLARQGILQKVLSGPYTPSIFDKSIAAAAPVIDDTPDAAPGLSS